MKIPVYFVCVCVCVMLLNGIESFHRVGKDKHLRKSSHIASKHHPCQTPVPIFRNLSKYLIPKNYYSNGRVRNKKKNMLKILIFVSETTKI